MRALILAAVLASAPFTATAGTTGSLTGIVTTPGGAPVSNAKVSAASPAQFISTRTDSTGHFAFVSLTPGAYNVAVEHEGFQPVTMIGVVVFADSTRSVALSMSRALIFLIRAGHYDGPTPVRPGIVGDLYAYGAYQIMIAPPVQSDTWMLRMTPGITFGAGTPVTH